jgi:2-polyprenyl-6-methoxyphenol hydroxylase-like FAD-dependent oxidoreductase
VAGAGPVGLFLARELRLAGLSVLVLERQEDPHSPLKRLPFGMRGLSAPSIEGFYRRGMLDDIAALQRSKEGYEVPGTEPGGAREGDG